MEHTEGKWIARKEILQPKLGAYDIWAGDKWIATINHRLKESEANAQRIVACVNACEDMSTKGLESNGSILGHLNHLTNSRDKIETQLSTITQQRDELLEALKELANEFGSESTYTSIIQQAIKNAEEGR